MPIYEFTAKIDGGVFAEDSYEAMKAIEEKIKSGEVSPEEINIQKEEKGGDGNAE